ncbi:hypothetical protein BS47DRAFT_1396956 [Hydnum rufescens UP504]|uniref:Uncharacterized protein n=1 Tax=Hydnum rufescens UP504 TaxID=1448309 RepID=A0A9P6DPT1_9AGAM|nr:hypothetical protein BS47DRAFT_1396956 [Hydnum rufescens UP504]
MLVLLPAHVSADRFAIAYLLSDLGITPPALESDPNSFLTISSVSLSWNLLRFPTYRLLLPGRLLDHSSQRTKYVFLPEIRSSHGLSSVHLTSVRFRHLEILDSGSVVRTYDIFSLSPVYRAWFDPFEIFLSAGPEREDPFQNVPVSNGVSFHARPAPAIEVVPSAKFYGTAPQTDISSSSTPSYAVGNVIIVSGSNVRDHQEEFGEP